MALSNKSMQLTSYLCVLLISGRLSQFFLPCKYLFVFSLNLRLLLEIIFGYECYMVLIGWLTSIAEIICYILYALFNLHSYSLIRNIVMKLYLYILCFWLHVIMIQRVFFFFPKLQRRSSSF